MLQANDLRSIVDCNLQRLLETSLSEASEQPSSDKVARKVGETNPFLKRNIENFKRFLERLKFYWRRNYQLKRSIRT